MGTLTRAELLRRGAAGLVVLAGSGGVAYEALDAASYAATPRPGSGGGTGTTGGAVVHAFESRPDLKPPVIEVVHRARGTAPGYLFLAPSSGPGERGALIVDDAGEIVWFQPTVPNTAMNLRAALYRGKPVLTWWEGKSKNGIGVGECVIVDQSYREIARFKAGNGRPADLHELLLTPRNTALVTADETRTMNLTSIGGRRRHPVIGSIVQELAVPSGKVLFDWRSLDHVPLAESHQGIGPRFDYFHANSIDLDSDGSLLVSARNTWAVYKVSRRNGSVLWRLGGKKSDFAMGRGTFFAWQHDARSHSGGKLVTIFDNGGDPRVEPQSSALVLALDTRRMRATLSRRYVHHPPMKAKYTGNAQLLGNGDMLVGWGSEPFFTEFARDGSVRFDARLPRAGQTYRVLRFPWVGKPGGAPALVARKADGASLLYASWNGATEIASWQLHAGKSASALQPVSTVPKRGFETSLRVATGPTHAAVVALDASGKPLGRSRTIAL